MAGLLASPPVRRPSHPDGSGQWHSQAEQVLQVSKQGHSGGSAPDFHRFPSCPRGGTIEATSNFRRLIAQLSGHVKPENYHARKHCASGGHGPHMQPSHILCCQLWVRWYIETTQRKKSNSALDTRKHHPNFVDGHYTIEILYRGGRYSRICRRRNPERVRKDHGCFRIDGRTGPARHAGDAV